MPCFTNANTPGNVLWERKTPHFIVRLTAEFEQSPDSSWWDDEIREKMESGEYGAYVFCVQVIERGTGAEIGAAYLGDSIYADPRDFVDHRACGRANREYAAKGAAGRCGSYFSDMMGEAIAEARKAYATPRATLRAA